jgi:hypothetical protein
MNIWSPRAVRSTSIGETIAMMTPKKLCLRTPPRTSSRVSGESAPSAEW